MTAALPAMFSSLAACSGNGTPPDAETRSDGGDGGPSEPCLTSASGVAPSCIIDDMTNIASETGGYWYTFSDRTVPFGTDLVAGAMGFVDPREGAQFPPDNVVGVMGQPAAPTGPSIGGTAVAERTFTGGGLTIWGGGFGMDFDDPIQPDAGAPATDGGDGGGGTALGVPAPFDGSAHHGFGFWGKSNSGANQRVGVHLADKNEANGGGVCDSTDAYAVLDGGADIIKNPTECGVDFLMTVQFHPAWTFYAIPWAAFGGSQSYSGTGYKSVDPKNLFYLHFQVNNSSYAGIVGTNGGAVAPGPDFSISVAYVTWYDGTTAVTP